MRIIDVKALVFEESVLPSICFEVTLGRTKLQEAIISISGWLKSNNEKTISNLIEECPEQYPDAEEVGARGRSMIVIFKKKPTELLLERFWENRQLASHMEGDNNFKQVYNMRINQNRSISTSDS